MQESFSVEPHGEIVVVRMRGMPTQALLLQCHERMRELVNSSGRRKILYDVLEMTVPDLDLVYWQLHMVEAKHFGDSVKRAIVVPNSKLAYLARIAFGEHDYHVFYNDLAAAIKWLEDTN